jgi:hypothetical protein
MANLLTPAFRVSYPNVFKPKLNQLSNKEEYSLVALFPKGTDLSALKKAAQEAVVAKWGADEKKWPKNLRNPMRDQADLAKTNDDGVEIMPGGTEKGAIFMNLKSTNKPGLIGPNREDIIDSAEFYAGCWARCSLSVYAYSQAGNNGVGFGLQNIQKVKDGEPLSGRPKAQDEFAAVALPIDAAATSLFG